MNKTSLIDKAAAIYEKSPVLKAFEEGCPAHANMTKKELVRLMVSVLRIAAKTGTYQLARTILGDLQMPKYKDESTGSIDVAKHWDELPLESREECRRFILEAARLLPPVAMVHRVATEPFTCDFSGTPTSFPAGTLVIVPLSLGNLDRGFWGPTAYEFDHHRENLEEHFLGFNSVGARGGRRVCPGRELALDVLCDILAYVGRARRQAMQGGSCA